MRSVESELEARYASFDYLSPFLSSCYFYKAATYVADCRCGHHADIQESAEQKKALTDIVHPDPTHRGIPTP
jgi:hypothetical protein